MPEMPFYVVLPWPPSANALYRNNRGNTHLTSAARLWYKTAIATIQMSQGYKEHRWKRPTRLRVSLQLVPPTLRDIDIDNRIKPVHDALEKSGLIENDNMIFASDQIKHEKLVGGVSCAYVMVERLPDSFGKKIRDWTCGLFGKV